MRQGNDIGSQYRSAIFCFDEKHLNLATHSLLNYQKSVNEKFNDKPITTTIEPLDKYYFAEEYHQQYLAKNPNGYCAMKGLGVACKI
jgi:peptide-methionine (S)-S-oxide reductase